MPREKGTAWVARSRINAAVCCFLVFALALALVQRHRIEHHDSPTTPVIGAQTFLGLNSSNIDAAALMPKSAEEFAETAFEFWHARIHSHIASLEVRNTSWRGADDDTWQRLQDLGLSSSGDHCLYLYSYEPLADGRLRVSWDENSRVCRSEADHFYKRAKVLAAALEMVMEPHRDEFDHPFQVRLEDNFTSFL